MPDESNAPKLTPTRAVARQATSAVAFVAEPPDADDPLLDFAPVPHVAPRRNSITPERQRAFIAQLAATGIVKQAARHVGASLEALNKLRHRRGAEGFRAAWDMALDRGVARLEDCALARAIEGEERLVVSGGKVLGVERRHNESLVMFFLRMRRGERYAAQWREIRPGHPVYEAVRAELADEFAARQAEADAEAARRLAEAEARYDDLLRRLDEDEEEWEAEQERLAEEAEAARSPEERERDALLHHMRRWSLAELQRRVKW